MVLCLYEPLWFSFTIFREQNRHWLRSIQENKLWDEKSQASQSAQKNSKEYDWLKEDQNTRQQHWHLKINFLQLLSECATLLFMFEGLEKEISLPKLFLINNLTVIYTRITRTCEFMNTGIPELPFWPLILHYYVLKHTILCLCPDWIETQSTVTVKFGCSCSSGLFIRLQLKQISQNKDTLSR